MSDEEQDPGEGLNVNWSNDELSLKDKVQVPPKFWYLLIAILCATLGVSYEEIMEVVGI